jgi:hypothetical protein
MKVEARLFCILALAAALLASCVSPPPEKTEPVTQQAATSTPVQPEPQKVEQTPAEKFVATEELYRKTFAEVQEVIAALQKIIADGNYDQWLTYLTADYVKLVGSPEFLAQASSSGVLKKSGIVLNNLKDYFDEVVVRSHLQATLDDITFVDATHVKALTEIQGTPVILHYLVREGGRWKVGIQQTVQNTR